MRSSVVRNFRYAATITASQLVTSWIRVIISLTDARETAQNQLAGEEKKKGSKVGVAKLLGCMLMFWTDMTACCRVSRS